MVQLFCEAVWQFLKNLNIVLLCDSDIPLLVIDPRELETVVHKGNFIWMFIAYKQNMETTLMSIS